MFLSNLHYKNTSKLTTSLIDKVMERINLDDLSDTLADQLASKLVDSIKIESLVSSLFDKYGDELQRGLSDTTLQGL